MGVLGFVVSAGGGVFSRLGGFFSAGAGCAALSSVVDFFSSGGATPEGFGPCGEPAAVGASTELEAGWPPPVCEDIFPAALADTELGAAGRVVLL